MTTIDNWQAIISLIDLGSRSSGSKPADYKSDSILGI